MVSFSSAAMFIASCTVNSGCKLSFCIIYADNLRNSLRFLAFELTIMFPVTPAVLKTVQMVMKFIRGPIVVTFGVYFHFSFSLSLFFFVLNFRPRLSSPSSVLFCFAKGYELISPGGHSIAIPKRIRINEQMVQTH